MFNPQPKKARRRNSSGPQSEQKRLVANCDRWLSEYIRRRDANDEGFAQCCTCGRIFHWSDGENIHAGHFITRTKMVTRYHVQNVHAQCARCNCDDVDPGKQFAHGQHIDRLYGPGTAQKIHDLSRMRGFKPTRLWLEDKLQELKTLCKAERQRLKGV